MATKIQIKLPQLHAAQQEIVDSPARFKVICCGRRFGKTQLAIDVLTNAIIDGENTAYFSTTYKNVSGVWRSLMEVLLPIEAKRYEGERYFEAITGGTLECWSSEKISTALGRKYHKIVVDEASLIADLEREWNEYLRAMLADYEGEAIFPGTPKGYNYFWRLWNRGDDPTFEDWASWNFPTSSNPHIKQVEIDSAEREVPQRFFRQEYLAQFIEDAGGVFRGVSAISTALPSSPNGGRYIMGVDWGKSNDFTVISIIDANTNTQVYMDRFNQISWALQRGRLRTLYDEWQPEVIVAESNSIGDVNIEALEAEGLPVVPFATTANTKAPLIDALALAIERKEITLLQDNVQKLELQSYQMKRLPSGRFQYSAPDGGHDDTVIATALALHGCQTYTPIQVVRLEF